MTPPAGLERFLALSAELTGFTIFELRGTGQAEAYLSAAVAVVSADRVADLLDVHGRAPPESGPRRAAYLRRTILGDTKFGPVARNITKLWYLGIWYELPSAWAETYGVRAANLTFMASAGAYTEGLVWPAIGANPPGAKAPGFASWVGPPQIPSF